MYDFQLHGGLVVDELESVSESGLMLITAVQ